MTYEEQFEEWFNRQNLTVDNDIKQSLWKAFKKGAEAGWESHEDQNIWYNINID